MEKGSNRTITKMRKIYQIDLTKIANREIGMTAERWRDLETSIRLLGVMVPIIIDKQYRVWDGVHRVYMAKLIGLKTIPAIKIDSNRYTRPMLDCLLGKIMNEYAMNSLNNRLKKQEVGAMTKAEKQRYNERIGK